MIKLNLELLLSVSRSNLDVIVRNSSTGDIVFEGISYEIYSFKHCEDWEVMWYGIEEGELIIDVEKKING